MNQSIKFKTNFFKKPVIDWKYIKETEEVNKKFNINLRNRLKTTSNYTNFNDAILRSGEETSMKKINEEQGWYHFIRATLTTTLEARNSVLHAIRDKNNTPSSRTLRHLKTLQPKVDEAVSAVKTRWSCHLAEEIHNMSFNPK